MDIHLHNSLPVARTRLFASWRSLSSVTRITDSSSTSVPDRKHDLHVSYGPRVLSLHWWSYTISHLHLGRSNEGLWVTSGASSRREDGSRYPCIVSVTLSNRARAATHTHSLCRRSQPQTICTEVLDALTMMDSFDHGGTDVPGGDASRHITVRTRMPTHGLDPACFGTQRG